MNAKTRISKVFFELGFLHNMGEEGKIQKTQGAFSRLLLYANKEVIVLTLVNQKNMDILFSNAFVQ